MRLVRVCYHFRHALRQSYFGFLSPLSSVRPWAKPEPSCVAYVSGRQSYFGTKLRLALGAVSFGKIGVVVLPCKRCCKRITWVFHSFEFSYTHRLEHLQKHGRRFCSRTPCVPGLFVVVCSSSGFRWVCACKQPSQMACALHAQLRPNVVPEYTSSHPYFMLALLLTICTLGWASNTLRYRRCSVYVWARALIIVYWSSAS